MQFAGDHGIDDYEETASGRTKASASRFGHKQLMNLLRIKRGKFGGKSEMSGKNKFDEVQVAEDASMALMDSDDDSEITLIGDLDNAGIIQTSGNHYVKNMNNRMGS